jgi:hypothetical protein
MPPNHSLGERIRLMGRLERLNVSITRITFSRHLSTPSETGKMHMQCTMLLWAVDDGRSTIRIRLHFSTWEGKDKQESIEGLLVFTSFVRIAFSLRRDLSRNRRAHTCATLPASDELVRNENRLPSRPKAWNLPSAEPGCLCYGY